MLSRIKLQWLALGLCLLFGAFSLGFYLGGRPQSGTYTIITERAPDDAPPPAAGAADIEVTPDGASVSAAPPASAVPSAPAPASALPSAASDNDRDIRININTASAEELTDLPGVGPVLAGRIVAYRDEHGPFAAPEDIINVSGIGPKKLADILPHITIGG